MTKTLLRDLGFVFAISFSTAAVAGDPTAQNSGQAKQATPPPAQNDKSTAKAVAELDKALAAAKAAAAKADAKATKAEKDAESAVTKAKAERQNAAKLRDKAESLERSRAALTGVGAQDDVGQPRRPGAGVMTDAIEDLPKPPAAKPAPR